MNKATLFVAFLFCTLSASAQLHKQRVSVVKYAGETAINTPVLNDSTNVKGKAYSLEMLLTNSTFSPSSEKEYLLDISPNDSALAIRKPEKGYTIHRLRFNFLPDRYGKVKIEIKAQGIYELYVNDKKEGSKSSFNELIPAKANVHSLTVEPRFYEVSLKYIASAEGYGDEKVIIDLVNESDKDPVHFKISTTDKHPVYIEDLIIGTRPGYLSMSGSGKYGFVTMTTTTKDGKSSYKPYLLHTESGKITPAQSEWRWMPQSDLIYYIYRGIYSNELRTVNPETMEEKTLASSLPNGNFTWSPDERFLIFSEYESADRPTDPIHRLLSPDDRQEGWRSRCNLYKYDLATGLKQQLTYGYRNSWLNDISHDGQYLLFSVQTETLTERPFDKSTLILLNTATLKTDTIWKNEGFASGAQFSPDDKSLLIIGSGEAFKGIGLQIKEGQISNLYNKEAFILNLEDRQIKPITRNFNPSINSATWNKADNKIYFTCADKDYVNVYSYDVKNEKFNKLPLKEDVIGSFIMNDKNQYAIYTGQSVCNSTRFYRYHVKKQTSELLADPRADEVDNFVLADVKDWNFTASDGATIEGRYCLPAQYDSTKTYPLIVYYYSGTTPTERLFEFRYSMHLFSAMGYVVYIIQPSGTIGYGQEFAARHVNAWGIRTAEDIIEGTKKFCSDHAFVNKNKVGCIGASYGGFMTMYLQTRTDIFAAAVSHAGISALTSYWGEGFWGYSYSAAASANSYPWNNPQLYTEQSPLFHADKINTPILLLHGTSDTNVPIGESIQMYTALKLLGKEAEFLQVAGENHGIMDFNKRLVWQKSILAWFNRWLKDEPTWWETLYPKQKL